MAKPMPWNPPLRRGDGGVDADDLAVEVDQRAAAVARVDRGVDLDEVLVSLLAEDADLARLRALTMPWVIEPT